LLKVEALGDERVRADLGWLWTHTLATDWPRREQVPTHWMASWVSWDLPHRYAVYYPVTGSLAVVEGAGGGLERLIGTNRARLLPRRRSGREVLARWLTASSPRA